MIFIYCIVFDWDNRFICLVNFCYHQNLIFHTNKNLRQVKQLLLFENIDLQRISILHINRDSVVYLKGALNKLN